MPVVHQNNEVRHVRPGFRLEPVGNFQAEPMVLDLGAHPRMRLRDAIEFGLPLSVVDRLVDVAAVGVGLPPRLLRRGEADVHRGADRVVGVKHRLDGPLLHVAGHDPAGDTFAGGVREALVQELGGIRTASTWRKKGLMSAKRWLRQCFSTRAVSGVTRHRPNSGIKRHASTRRRRSLMTSISSYC